MPSNSTRRSGRTCSTSPKPLARARPGGRDPHDRALSDLIGELSTRSETFRTLWAEHNVRFHRTGTKIFHHPVVGDIELSFASWAATLEQQTAASKIDG